MIKPQTTIADELDGALLGFSIICVTYGIALGTISLGAGLTMLTVVQGIGFGILGFGAGMLYGITFGAKAIISSIVKALEERLKERQGL